MATYNKKGVGFNIEHNAQLTEDEFIKHESHHGFKKDELAAIHKQIKKQYNAAKKAEKEPESVIVDEAGVVVPFVENEEVASTPPAAGAATVSTSKPKS